jgi:hypothetical protein
MKTYGRVTQVTATLAAIAVSGIAIADPDPNRVTGKDKPKGSPGQVKSKSSIEVENECVPYFKNPDDKTGDSLRVISRITNESEDLVTISTAYIEGVQLVPDATKKNNKKTWIGVGAVTYPEEPAVPFSIPADPDSVSPPLEYVFDIDLCTMTDQPLSPEATALNVTTQFMIKEGDEQRNFYNNCDDLDIDGDGDKTNDGDQSRIDIEDFDLAC